MASRARTPNSASNSGITAFATVGTTRFDLFVQRLDDPQVQTALRGIGIDKLVVQKGNSSVSPQSRVEGMKVEAFEFAHGLQSYFDSASLVLSHAGSGSILEALRAKVPHIIVVVNELLMDNHQAEVAEEMARQGYVTCCTVSTLLRAIQAADIRTPPSKEFPRPQPQLITRVVRDALEEA